MAIPNPLLPVTRTSKAREALFYIKALDGKANRRSIPTARSITSSLDHRTSCGEQECGSPGQYLAR